MFGRPAIKSHATNGLVLELNDDAENAVSKGAASLANERAGASTYIIRLNAAEVVDD